MKFIDLSVPINENTPVYPDDPKVKIQKAGVLEKDGYQDHLISFGNHNGTHIDASSHMIAGGKNLDQIPLDQFIGRGVYIKVENGFTLDQVKLADIRERDIVLFHTGMSNSYHQPSYYDDYPAMSEEVAEYLVEKKVKMVGVDMCSPDKEPFPIHRILLKNNILILENLTNLESLARQSFTVYAFPIKLQIDGAPARVMAEILD